MRIAILLSVTIFCVSFTNTCAQDDAPTISRTIFKLSPQHFIHNSLKAGIERFNSTHSGSIAFFVTGRIENEDSGFNLHGYSGVAGEVQLSKYISPMKMRTTKKNNSFHQGIYGAAYLQGGSYAGEFSEQQYTYDPNTGQQNPQTLYEYHESIANYGFGFTLGYQKTLWQVVFLEAFVGGGIQFSESTVTGGNKPEHSFFTYGGIANPGYKGILPKIGLHLGIGL